MKMRGDYLITKERERQIVEEGWTEEHDAQHSYLEFVKAAISYCMTNFDVDCTEDHCKAWWPWDLEWYKPKTKIRNLVRAGALIAAAIDKLQKDKEENESI